MNQIDYFKQHEGLVPHLYLDIYGLVTCGVGFLVSTPEDMKKWDWRDGTGRLVTQQECKDAWNTVHDMKHGVAYPASFFKYATQLRLTQDAIDATLITNLAAFTMGLRKRWPNYDTFPEGPRLALLDMAYSLGVRGLVAGYPMLGKMVDRCAWEQCSLDCHRRGVSDSRNADCAKLFGDSATVQGVGSVTVGEL